MPASDSCITMKAGGVIKPRGGHGDGVCIHTFKKRTGYKFTIKTKTNSTYAAKNRMAESESNPAEHATFLRSFSGATTGTW